MKEVISISIGQAGIQLSNACWQLFCLQYGIQPDGTQPDGSHVQNSYFPTFFSESRTGKFTPRSVYVDLEPTVIDEVKTGLYRDLFSPETLVSGKNDAATFARGYYTAGKEIVDIALDRIRKVADSCHQLQGFLVLNSIAGGTGSGLTSLLIERLKIDYGNRTKMGFEIYPSPQGSLSVVQPYNAGLAERKLGEAFDVKIVFQNEALSDICKSKLDIDYPTYTNINRILALLIASLTASLRFEGALHQNLSEFQTNLIPYQYFNSLLCSYSPIRSVERQYKLHPSVAQITNELFDPSNLFAKCNPRLSKYLACTLVYRGQIVPKDISSSFASLKTKRTVQFIDWAPVGFKLGINYQFPTMVPGGYLAHCVRSAYVIANSAAVSEVFDCIERKFDLMYSKRAFVHWFVSQGMEEGEFTEARDSLASLQKDYEEACLETAQDGEEEG